MVGVRLRAVLVLAGACAAVLLAAAPARSQAMDHLQCYEAKDDKQAAKLLRAMTFDLSGSAFLPESCQLVELKRFCTPIDNQLVEPPKPIFTVEGQAAAGSYACYKVVCTEKVRPGAVPIVDQFGDRTIELGRTLEVCAPVEGVPDEG
jgi:hypothetical protein